MSKNRYSKQVQNTILKEYLTCTSINDLSERHFISKSTIYRWIKLTEEEKSNAKSLNNKKAIEILSVKS